MVESLEARINFSGGVAAATGLSRLAEGAARAEAVSLPQVRPSTALGNSLAGQVTVQGVTIPYRLFVPTLASPKQKVPLILFLHGVGDGGTDNVSQTYWMGNLQASTAAGADAAFVLAPQLPFGWVFGIAQQTPTIGMSLTTAALRQVMKNKNVDTKRIYVTGVSMGAYGAWDIVRRNPRLFAAAVPMSYLGDPGWASTIKGTPVWAFQGTADSVNPVDGERAFIHDLIAAGGLPRYTEIAGGGHQIWDPLYADPALYAWMFSKHLAHAPR